MATVVNSNVTPNVWINISTLHGLTDDQKYYIQNIGNSEMSIIEAGSQPTYDQRGHIIGLREPFYFIQDAADDIWVISRGGTTEYAITEAE